MTEKYYLLFFLAIASMNLQGATQPAPKIIIGIVNDSQLYPATITAGEKIYTAPANQSTRYDIAIPESSVTDQQNQQLLGSLLNASQLPTALKVVTGPDTYQFDIQGDVQQLWKANVDGTYYFEGVQPINLTRKSLEQAGREFVRPYFKELCNGLPEDFRQIELKSRRD